jgi:TolA-binding protein
MTKNGMQLSKVALVLIFEVFSSGTAFGQAAPQQQQQPGQPAPQPGQQPSPNNPHAAPLTLDDTTPPVNAEEDAAVKAFRDTRLQEQDKKDKLAEDFVQKYPQSRYAPEVYNWLVRSYYRKGEVDKMESAADKQLAAYPNDPQTLAIVGTTLPRAMNASTPDPGKRLAKAEQYCQKALDLLPTIQKPEGMTDEMFQQLKSTTAAMAYSGLGMVAFRRGKYSDAIPELENAVKADPKQPDPVNYYVLGLADEKASHFDDAAAAFTKCSVIPGGMQATCAQNIEEAKKLGATQLNTPK